MKATEQYFPVVLFIMLYKVVLTFEAVDEIQTCRYTNLTVHFLLCSTICGKILTIFVSVVTEFPALSFHEFAVSLNDATTFS